MKTNKHVAVTMLALLIVFIPSLVLAQGGLESEMVSQAKSIYDLVFAVVPWIAAVLILIAIFMFRSIGIGYTVLIVFACVIAANIPEILTFTGLSLT